MSFVPIEFKEDVELLRLPGPVQQIITSESCKNISVSIRKSISLYFIPAFACFVAFSMLSIKHFTDSLES